MHIIKKIQINLLILHYYLHRKQLILLIDFHDKYHFHEELTLLIQLFQEYSPILLHSKIDQFCNEILINHGN